MKIYFAGSITGGRNDANLYAEVIKLLGDYGTVLTEHVGAKTLNAMGEQEMTAEEIFTRDINWIREADVLVAEITTPSLGVGYELGFAESLGKKIICLYREQPGKQISKMICGNSYNTCIAYSELDDLKEIFDKNLL